MLAPTSHPWTTDQTLGEHFEARGVSRREFLDLCGKLTAMLGLASVVTPRMAEALTQVRKPSVIWIQLQECTGCVESVIRTSEPSIGDLLLDTISLD